MKLFRNITLSLALAGACAVSAAPDLPVKTVNGKEYYYFEVPSKTTIYSLTRQLGYTRDEIIKYNPQVKDGLRAGDTLYFPVVREEEQAEKEEVALEVEAVDEVEEAAEEVEAAEDKSAVTENSEVTEAPVEPVADDEEVTIAEEIEEIDEPVEEIPEESVNVGVMLPFMLEAEGMTRQTENNTNFYRGMLLAVNDLASASDMKINVFAYDTEGSAATVERLMANGGLPRLDYIIAPGDSASIERIASVADSMDATVVNLFAVKNESHKRHESILQANIPSRSMYDRAMEGFCDRYAGSKVIILNPTDIHVDKSEFTDELMDCLVKKGIPYERINFEGKLTPESLSELPVSNYVFVPTGGSREVLMRILPTLSAYRAAFPDQDISLFGYPEWVTHRGEIKDQLHKLNAVVYSRFSTNLDSDAVRNVRAQYKQWFGSQMPQSVPNSVLLGYDTMAWIISASLNGLTEPYEGVQNTFKILETEGAGNVNNALYFLNFRSNGAIEPIVL